MPKRQEVLSNLSIAYTYIQKAGMIAYAVDDNIVGDIACHLAVLERLEQRVAGSGAAQPAAKSHVC